MTSIAHKKQLSLGLPRLLRGAVADGKQIQGQEWPCHVVAVDGAIVTIAFDVGGDFTLPQVTCPIAESRYVRLPVQAGDTGYVTAASARLGGVTDLGAGVAPMVLPSNLGGLVFVPLGRKSWDTIDANAVVIQAPNGSKILTDDGASEIIVDTSQVKVVQGETTVTVSGGNVTIEAPNNVTITVPLTTINGNLVVNGDAEISGDLHVGADVAVDGSVGVGGDVAVVGAVACASVACAGAGAFLSLTINGHPYTGHTHPPGSYHAGSTAITGASGGAA